jgi:hypothetical protein
MLYTLEEVNNETIRLQALKEADSKIIAELKAENYALQEKVNSLTMDNMTHEFNNAEAEKFRSHFEEQLLEPYKKRIKELELKLFNNGIFLK